MRDPLITRLPVLLDALTEALLPYLDIPAAFFGHSMGALISFEIAHRLRTCHNHNVAQLFISAHRAPQVPRTGPSIHRLLDPDLVEELRRINGTPEPVLQNTELMQLVLPALRADLAICETYAYATKEPLSCPISVFGGRHDASTRPSDLTAWQAHTRHTCTLRLLPGNHFFLHESRPLLLRAISEDLARAESMRSG